VAEEVFRLHVGLVVEGDSETFEVPTCFQVARVAAQFDNQCAFVATVLFWWVEVEDVLLKKTPSLGRVLDRSNRLWRLVP